MTRSLHSDPAAIRAARRAAAPGGSRANTAAARRRQARVLKAIGLSSHARTDDREERVRPVRIRVSRARPGHVHPLSRQQIADALDFFGPLARYGLRSVELRRSDAEPGSMPVLARLLVPGIVILYEQPVPPWQLDGRPSERSIGRLTAAGARVLVGPTVTSIDWPDGTLAELMLFDGLLHEIGHHIVQHHKGKRGDRVMRTADHERAAERYVAACRIEWSTRSAVG